MITIYIKSKTYGVKGIHIDAKDFALVNKYHWSLKKHKNSNTFYTETRHNYKQIFLHRLLMNFPSIGIDHINGNGLDNRKSNLRLCNQSQNACNRFKQKNNKTGYKGVYYKKDKRRIKRWLAKININKKTIMGGYFLTVKEAAYKYNELALEYHGEFANLNIID